MIPTLRRKGNATVSLAFLLAFLIIAIVVPTTATADVKSETLKVDDSTGFSFSLQLKEGETVFWEWEATPEETGDDATTDFMIYDEDDDEVARVVGKTSDEGEVLIDDEGTYFFSWEPEDDIMLAYTITYEPMVDAVCCGSVIAIGGVLAVIAVLGFVAVNRRK